ncbi:hypothetical protein ACFQPA_20410 [Halomarina halobia]|uniref:Uncharacterized protein n=1 Tax=Halomarina halobia TaxID=3033386 RepID=A0ABD6AEL9_9EURY|nr:hypothetical protein [Halomarina sp. PSR21]
MSTNATTQQSDELSEIDLTILTAVNKGFRYVADILDYCGPQLDQEGQGWDCSTYMLRIDRLIDLDYLRRNGNRFNGFLEITLTERGRSAVPPLSEEETSLLGEYGISIEALNVLKAVIEYEEEHGTFPSTNQLIERTEFSDSCYQCTALFNRIVDAGLAVERGILRYKIEPTDEGRKLVANRE